MTHTHGPWNAFHWSDNEHSIVLDSSLSQLAAKGEFSPDDARLVAAAPELLEELERMANDMDSLGYSVVGARAVIAKARGTSST